MSVFLYLSLMLPFLCFTGCAASGRVNPENKGLSGFSYKAEDLWTILCATIDGPDHVLRSNSLAERLRAAPGLVPERVFVFNGRNKSQVCYGHYYRKGDKRTGTFETPGELAEDKTMVLRQGGDDFLFEARVIPVPMPDAGKPQWELSNNPGQYSLRVALFYREPGFSRRKQAAAAYCEELREKGYEAWYRHGELTSEVFVGSFGEDARVPCRKFGVLYYAPSEEVTALQNKENFLYELWNMKAWSSKEGQGRRIRSSKLFNVHDEPEGFYEY